MAKNCRNRRTEGRIEKGKKLEYEGNNGQRRIIEGKNKQNINLNGDKNLMVFNQILVQICLQYSGKYILLQSKQWEHVKKGDSKDRARKD